MAVVLDDTTELRMLGNTSSAFPQWNSMLERPSITKQLRINTLLIWTFSYCSYFYSFTINFRINFGILHCLLAQLNSNHLFHSLKDKRLSIKAFKQQHKMMIQRTGVTLARDIPMVPVPQHTSRTVLSASSWAHSPTAEYSTSAAPVFTFFTVCANN